jgi:uncharacterized membrane protein (DUF4010 family)
MHSLAAADPSLITAAHLGMASLVGAAVGFERELSGQAAGAERFAGIRTFLILGLVGGIVGHLSQSGYPIAAAVLLAGAVGLVVAAYASTSRRPEMTIDGTTEAAALVVLGLSALAGIGEMALAAGAVSIVVVVLGEKQRLHGGVAKIGAVEMRAAARFAVMALVILPLLPTTELPLGGGISLRNLWTLVLLFSGINFAGFVARRAAGPERGYAVTGLLGGLISSTAVTFQFARQSRTEPSHGAALALGTLAACTVLPVRLLVVLAVLSPAVSWEAVPFLAPPALVGIAFLFTSFRRRPAPAAEERLPEPSSPLNVFASIRMTALFWLALVAIGQLQALWGNTGVFASAGLLGLTDMDALTVAMARLGDGGVGPRIAATGVAIGVLSNTAFKATLGAVLGSRPYRKTLALGLVVLGLAVGVGWLL